MNDDKYGIDQEKNTGQENSMTLEKEQMNNPLLLPFYTNMTK